MALIVTRGCGGQGDEVAVSHVIVRENRQISGCRQGVFTVLCLVLRTTKQTAKTGK